MVKWVKKSAESLLPHIPQLKNPIDRRFNSFRNEQTNGAEKNSSFECVTEWLIAKLGILSALQQTEHAAGLFKEPKDR